jgi:hypothetical protein
MNRGFVTVKTRSGFKMSNFEIGSPIDRAIVLAGSVLDFKVEAENVSGDVSGGDVHCPLAFPVFY